MPPLKQYTREQVRCHATENDIWIIIDTMVYNMSDFIDLHPGGAFPILEYAGKDATDAFYGLHRQEVLLKYARYQIGTIVNETPSIPLRQHGDISTVPYGEISAFMGYKSPYYK